MSSPTVFFFFFAFDKIPKQFGLNFVAFESNKCCFIRSFKGLYIPTLDSNVNGVHVNTEALEVENEAFNKGSTWRLYKGKFQYNDEIIDVACKEFLVKMTAKHKRLLEKEQRYFKATAPKCRASFWHGHFMLTPSERILRKSNKNSLRV